MSGSTSDSLESKQSKPAEEKWLFTEDQLQNTPSRRDNVLPAKELNYRQQAANLIQDMGQRLPVNQLTINTAIVYMHRFYMFHSFQAFSRFVMAPTALFLAAKVEEQPRKLEHVIRICHSCLHPDKPHLDVHSDNYLKQAQQLVEHELLLLQTLGFDISIDHPHTHVVKCTQLVKASRDLSQMAYFMATNSLHLTTFCLEYKPTVVSAMCIHLSCKWSNYEIPLSSEGKAYWTYMDCTITESLLENIINEFLKILNLCPTRLRKLKNYKPSSRDGPGGSTPQSKDAQQPKPPTSKVPPGSRTANLLPATDSKRTGLNHPPSEVQKKPTASLTIAEYKNKREKELLHTNKQASSSAQANEKPPLNVTYEKTLQQQPTAAKSAHKPMLRPGHSDVKAGPQSTTHHKAMVDHKRSAKPPHPGQKPHSGLPSGIPGLQKPKHPTHQAHGVTQQHKDHPRMQPHQHQRPHVLHHAKPAVAKPKEIIPAKSREPQLAEKKNIQGSSQVLKPSANRGENLLAGMEQKVMEQIKAEKAGESTAKPVESSTFARPPPAHLLHTSSVKEHKSRRSMPDLSSQKESAASHGQASSATKALYKVLYDQYKKNPEALKQQLKLKVQTEPLSEEEKQIWQKLKKKKEVDRQKRKRKHEKHKLNRSQPIESHSATEGEDATPGGGPLTVRIKLPPSVRAEISKNQPASGSGPGPPLACSSGSDAIVTSPGEGISQPGRKRTHTHDISGHADHLSAKLPKKSESLHHQSSHDSAKHRHRRGKSGSRHHHHSKSHHSGHKIDEATFDEATFQQALSDAVSLVQSGQAAPNTGASEKAVPTVTLKRAGVQNGSADSYVAHSSKHDRHKDSGRSNQLCFDPSAPISATPPEDLFDAEEQQKAVSPNTPAIESADVSSPEMGEIIDDDEETSPFRDHLNDRSSRQKKAFLQKQHLNNNNLKEHWGSTSTSSGYTHPPSLTHQNAKFEGQKNYDSRLPPMLSLTVKPNRTEQR